MKKILASLLIISSFALLGCEEATELPNALTVLSRTPALNAAGVSAAGSVVVTFSTPIDQQAMTANNFLSDYVEYGGNHTAGTPDIVLFQWSNNNKTLTIGINGWSLYSASNTTTEMVQLVPRSGRFKDIFENILTDMLWQYYLPTPATTTTTTTSTTTTTQTLASSWGQITDPGYGPRVLHTVMVGSLSPERLWVIGGASSTATMEPSVWYTEDGTTWIQATAEAAYQEVMAHSSVIYGGKLWVIGGVKTAGFSPTDEVWSSVDGANWVLEGHGDFRARYGHTSVVFDNKMWILGGVFGGSSTTNEVLSSTDGVHWTLETYAPWESRGLHGSVLHNGAMWVIAGNTTGSGTMSDSWYSGDGVNWIQATAAAPFGGRWTPGVTAYDNKLWVISGFNSTNQAIDDVWYSADGITWAQPAANLPFPGRGYTQAATFNNKIWFIGGSENVPPTIIPEDAWYTPSP